MIKKISIIISFMLILCLFGCSNNNVEYSSKDVADSIADISSDADGNVVISLINGKTFSLGNLKGKDGKDGKDGINGVDGKDGVNGKDGINGINGSNGKDGKNGKDGTSLSNYIKDIYLEDENKLMVKYGNDSVETIKRFDLAGDYKVTINYELIKNNDTNLSWCPDPVTLYFNEGDDVKSLLPRTINFIDEDYDYREYKFQYVINQSIDNMDGLYIVWDLYDEYVELNGEMPNHDVEFTIKMQQLSRYNFNNYYLYNNEKHYINCREVYGLANYNIKFHNDLSIWFANMDGDPSEWFDIVIQTTNNEDTYNYKFANIDTALETEFKIMIASKQLDDFIYLPRISDIANECYEYSVTTTLTNLENYFNNKGFTNFDVVNLCPGFENTSGTEINIYLDSNYFINNCEYATFDAFKENYYYNPDIYLRICLEND